VEIDLTTNDTALIRPGEELNGDALEKYLRKNLLELSPAPSPDNKPIRIDQFPGGHSNLTYLVQLGGQEFVLRKPPLGELAPKAHDIAREFRLLTAINPFFPLSPRPYLLCEDPSIIGAPFYLMERRCGLIIRGDIPKQIGDDLTLRRRVSEAIIDTLAALHSIDIYSSGLVALGKPARFVTRQVEGWTERWHRAKTKDVPELDEVARWLADQIPAEPAKLDLLSATLLHNDFKLDNVILDPKCPSHVTGVLDWEMSAIGDPLIDIGLLLCYWPEKKDPEARRSFVSPVTTEPGWMTRGEITERYVERTGRDLSAIAFYETFALFKVAVAIQQIYFRFVQGQTLDERFRHFDSFVQSPARAALDLAQRSTFKKIRGA
jgi:aminoglycoside phosphotransferase (APT) family kinase protein